MEGSVPKVHFQVGFWDQAIHLPREAASMDAINKFVVKSTATENGKLQEVTEPLCIFICKVVGGG